MASVHLLNAGNVEQKEKYLADIVSGNKISCVAVTEPHAGSDVKNIRTKAQKVGSKYIINGSKIFITNGVHADIYFVAAKTSDALQQSGSITITAREIASGAPTNGVDLTITVTSTDDSTVTDSISIAVIPQIANGLITVMSDSVEAKPGEMIYGNVIVTNLGTANDTMRINTVEMDCNLDDAEVVLSPSMSSTPIPWSCTIAEGETAGTKVLTFRLTSAARSDMMVTFSEAYNVEPSWNCLLYTSDAADE